MSERPLWRLVAVVAGVHRVAVVCFAAVADTPQLVLVLVLLFGVKYVCAGAGATAFFCYMWYFEGIVLLNLPKNKKFLFKYFYQAIRNCFSFPARVVSCRVPQKHARAWAWHGRRRQRPRLKQRWPGSPARASRRRPRSSAACWSLPGRASEGRRGVRPRGGRTVPAVVTGAGRSTPPLSHTAETTVPRKRRGGSRGLW